MVILVKYTVLGFGRYVLEKVAYLSLAVLAYSEIMLIIMLVFVNYAELAKYRNYAFTICIKFGKKFLNNYATSK